MPQRALGGVATTISEMLGPRETHAFGILMYHRIAEPIPGRAEPTWNVPPELFRQQLEGLCDRGFVAWPLAKVLRHMRDGQPIPRKVFVITFDGAYENVYLNAFPILRLFQLPATVFLAAAHLDSTEPFPNDDWEEAGSGNVPYTTWRPLSTEECIEMQRSGLVELGAYAEMHLDGGGRREELVDDLRRSQRVLRERFHIERASLAFRCKNDGVTGAALSAAAEKAGVQCALTNEARLVRPGDSPFVWGRFAAEEHDTAASLAAKLSGWYDAFRSLGHTLLRRNPQRTPPPSSVCTAEDAARN
jgi:peptidoglycan/xylan/chitin deacetylase (PgdA/CDA1 family)